MTGEHETASYDKFSSGIVRGASEELEMKIKRMAKDILKTGDLVPTVIHI